MLLISDGGRHVWYAREEDVQAGATQQVNAKPIQLALSDAARLRGVKFLYRSAPLIFQNTGLNTYLKQHIYDGEKLTEMFRWPLIFGAVFLVVQLLFSIPKDIRRRKEMKYGRRLKGPILVTPKQFNKAIQGNGIGLKVDQCSELLRVPLRAEDQHFEIIGDTGSGKTTIILQMLRQIQTRGHSAILYDPACEFIERFYEPPAATSCSIRSIVGAPTGAHRKSLSAEQRRGLSRPRSSSRPMIRRANSSLKARRRSSRISCLICLRRSNWSNGCRIRRRSIGGSRDTELASLIDPSAPQQRSGVLGSLSLIADSFRLLPKKEDAKSEWTAREWSKERKGWIFITSQPAEREALRPLHSLWIDMLVLRLLSAPKPEQHPVWFVLDELASLQRLPQLHTAITENRKSRNPIVLGFQGKAQLEVIYGHLAEVMLSQPATKIFLKTTEPNAAEWVSRAIGKVEIERMKETHFDGSRTGRNFALDRQTEPLVLDSEISGLENLHAFLKHGNYVARFSFSVMDVPAAKPKFIERLEDDYIVREPAKKQAEEPKVAASVAPPPALQSNGQVPPAVTVKPAARERTQIIFPFGTGI